MKAALHPPGSGSPETITNALCLGVSVRTGETRALLTLQGLARATVPMEVTIELKRHVREI